MQCRTLHDCHDAGCLAAYTPLARKRFYIALLVSCAAGAVAEITC